jgi:hypothetical protein
MAYFDAVAFNNSMVCRQAVPEFTPFNFPNGPLNINAHIFHERICAGCPQVVTTFWQ